MHTTKRLLGVLAVIGGLGLIVAFSPDTSSGNPGCAQQTGCHCPMFILEDHQPYFNRWFEEICDIDYAIADLPVDYVYGECPGNLPGLEGYEFVRTPRARTAMGPIRDPRANERARLGAKYRGDFDPATRFTRNPPKNSDGDAVEMNVNPRRVKFEIRGITHYAVLYSIKIPHGNYMLNGRPRKVEPANASEDFTRVRLGLEIREPENPMTLEAGDVEVVDFSRHLCRVRFPGNDPSIPNPNPWYYVNLVD